MALLQADAAIDTESDASSWETGNAFSKNVWSTSNGGSTVTKSEQDASIYVVR